MPGSVDDPDAGILAQCDLNAAFGHFGAGDDGLRAVRIHDDRDRPGRGSLDGDFDRRAAGGNAHLCGDGAVGMRRRFDHRAAYFVGDGHGDAAVRVHPAEGARAPALVCR